MRTISAALIALSLLTPALMAEIPDIEGFRVVPQFPQPANGAFGVVGTATESGRFLLWNGETLYLQLSLGGHQIEPIATGYLGDPGFLALAPDNSTLAMGGGFNGKLYLIDFKNPSDFEAGADFDVPTHFSGVFLNNRLLLVDRATDDFTTSELVIIDIEALTAETDIRNIGSQSWSVLTLPASEEPQARLITKPLGSYSSSVYVNKNRTRLYAMDSNTRELRYFMVSDIISAFDNATTLDWATDGTPVGEPGDFFDGGVSGINPDGQLIIGGSAGFGQPGGVMYVDPRDPALVLATLDPAGTQPYYYVIYSLGSDEVIAIDGSGLPLHAYASTSAIAPIPPTSPCPIIDDILAQWTAFTAEFGITEFMSDMDGDGLPEYAVLRMIKGIGCKRDGSLNEATRVAFDLNLDAFDADTDAEALDVYRELIAALMITSLDVQTALTTLLGDNGYILTGDYTRVTCPDGGPCLPEFEEKPAEFAPVTTRDIDEPYSGQGDIDRDGTTNIREYNNVLANGGDITDFIVASSSPGLNGNGGIQRHSKSGGGGCFVATAVYGTPLAQEVDALRDVRDNYLLNTIIGASFVDTYYRISPALADVIAQSPTLRFMTRVLLTPVVLLAKLVSASPLTAALLLLFTGVAALKTRRSVRTSL